MYSCTPSESYSKLLRNYCMTEVVLNSILPRAYHIIDGLWFIASENTLIFTVVCPQKQKGTMVVNLPLGIIKLNMSCAATSSYLTLPSYYHNESKLNSSLNRSSSIDNLKSYNGSSPQIWIPCISTMSLASQNQVSLQYWKDTKEIHMRHLILTAYKSRKSEQHSMPRQIYLATTVPTLAILGMGFIPVYYKCKKNKCKKTSAKIYRFSQKQR